MKKIAIQGTLGSYHDIAAHKYFEGEEIELICCASFEDVFTSIRKDSQVIGMLAIENTIAGSLLHNNELLRQSGTQIIGEYKLRISHSFVCLPDESWEDLTEVNSHPIALMQCRDFLNQHPQLKVVEGEDTARSAEAIKNGNLKGHAAICSKIAAERYGMKVLQEGIETNKHNFTRFLVVADPWQVDELASTVQTRSIRRTWYSHCRTRKAACHKCCLSCRFTTSTSLRYSRCRLSDGNGNTSFMWT